MIHHKFLVIIWILTGVLEFYNSVKHLGTEVNFKNITSSIVKCPMIGFNLILALVFGTRFLFLEGSKRKIFIIKTMEFILGILLWYYAIFR